MRLFELAWGHFQIDQQIAHTSLFSFIGSIIIVIIIVFLID